jgi:hypothetical protein
LIEISGIKDFFQYSRIKTLLQSQLKNILSFEDRKFSKNQVTFAVYTNKNIEDLKNQIEGLSLESGSDQQLTVVVR